jgi:hypothetical protein
MKNIHIFKYTSESKIRASDYNENVYNEIQ